MSISKYTTLEDALFSATAERYGIINAPEKTEHISNMRLFCEKIYDPLCDHYGLILPYTSFYRNKEVNKRVGGSSTKSQHMLGQAMDICPRGLNGLTNAKLFKYIKENLPFDQLIWEFGNSTEPGWVHVSYSVLHRRQVLKAYKVNNTTKYDPYD
jgi:zinc D-Ala-D-Ala carboxypeptidase